MSITSLSNINSAQQSSSTSLAFVRKFNSYTALQTDSQRGSPMPEEFIELSNEAKAFMERNNIQHKNERYFDISSSRAVEISRKLRESNGDVRKMLGMDILPTYQPNVDFLNSIKQKIESTDRGENSVFAGLPDDTSRLQKHLSQHPDKAQELMDDLREHLPAYEKTPRNGNYADGTVWRNILALRTATQDVLGVSIYGSKI